MRRIVTAQIIAIAAVSLALTAAAIACESAPTAPSPTSEPTATTKPALPPAPTLTPTLTATPPTAPTQTSTPTESPIPTPTATPTLVPPASSNPSGLGDDQLEHLRQQLLDLINSARRELELVELVLDDNPTAQLHAEDERANCFSSQWSSNGMKSSMRYTLNGGLHFGDLLTNGSSYCPHDPLSYEYQDLSSRLAETHSQTMFPEYRDTVLNPTYRKVGIGIAYEEPNLWVVQLFTTSHIEFPTIPSIDGGTLTFAYRLINGASQSDDSVPSAAVFYDPPPYNLTRGQLARTSDGGLGQRIAEIRPNADPGSYWTEDEFEDELATCPDPYDVPADAKPPESYKIDSELHDIAQRACKAEPETVIVPWITSDVEPLPDGGNRVSTDLSSQIAQFGPGVYTLAIWADIDGQSQQVAEYSIFLE